MINKVKRNIPTLIVLILLVVGLIFSNATIAYADSNFEGSGTESDPYKITSSEKLVELATLVNNKSKDDNNEYYADLNYILTSDIDLSGVDWIPIAKDTTCAFKGEFNGDGYRVLNLTIGSSESANTQISYGGLFGYLACANIQNIGLENVYINTDIAGHNITGGLAGSIFGTTITNCYTKANITTKANNSDNYSAVGGLVGYAVNHSHVLNSYSISTVSGSGPRAYVGGLVGISQTYSTIENAYCQSNVSIPNSNDANLGALLGSDYDGKSLVKYSYYNSLNSSLATGTGFGTDNTISKTEDELKSSEFTDVLTNNAITVSMKYHKPMHAWSIVSSENSGLPMINHIGNSIGNYLPIASNVSVSGMAADSLELQAYYSYYDLDGDEESKSETVINWYRSDDENGTNRLKINGESGTSYIVKQEDIGFYIGFDVTPVSTNNSEHGETVVSNFVEVKELFAGGEGTELNPYLISTVEHLNRLGEFVNQGLYSSKHDANFATLYYKLANDIDLQATSISPIGLNAAYSFRGNFDGDGYIVKNLTITSTYQHAGLFGYTLNATIKNLGVVSVNIKRTTKTNNIAGGICGMASNSQFKNCFSTGNIRAESTFNTYCSIGGLVGYCVDNTVITNSYAIVNLHAIQSTSVTSDIPYVGGLAGILQTGAKVDNCYASGSVTYVSAKRYALGLVGAIRSSNCSIVNGYWNGVVAKNYPVPPNQTIIPETSTKLSISDYKNSVLVTHLNTNVQNSGDDTLKLWKLRITENYEFPMLNGIFNPYESNVAPYIYEVNLTGKSIIGEVLTGSYGYYDVENDASTSTVKWYRADDSNGNSEAEILGQDTNQYILTAEDENKYICYEVTPSNENGVGTARRSEYTSVVLDSSNWDGSAATSFSGGDGTEANPYQISTSPELAYLSQQVNSSAVNPAGTPYANLHYILVNDIKLGRFADFTPIGNSAAASFNGTFDGNNNTISEFMIGKSDTPNSSISECGLFGFANRAIIKNLNMTDVSIYTNGNRVVIGPIASTAYNLAKIINCNTSGSLTKIGPSNQWNLVGGLVGSLNNSTILNSTSSANLNCSEKLAVSGGLVAKTENYALVDFSYATGNVSSSSTTANYNGGLIGISDKSNIRNCYSEGSVSSTNAVAYNGGLIGHINNQTVVVNCYSLSNVSASGTSTNNLGGLIGNVAGNSTVKICYTTGDIVNDNAQANIGGIVGNNALGVLENCIYNKESSYSINGALLTDDQKKGVGAGTDNTTSRLESELKTELFVNELNDYALNWIVNNNFTIELWKIVQDKNNNYPMINSVNNQKTSFITKPYVSKPKIQGLPLYNKTITCVASFFDYNGNSVSGIYKWFRADDINGLNKEEIAGAVSDNYTVTELDANKYLFVEVTPTANGEIGNTVSTCTQTPALGPDYWNGDISNSFAGGDGSIANPYLISKGSELAYLAKVINDSATHASYSDKHYLLTNNIKLSSATWTPIGTSPYPFKGNFNGNKYEISELHIGNENLANTVEHRLGLFGHIVDATIENVGVVDTYMFSRANGIYAGGIVSHASNSRVDSCYTTGDITSNAPNGQYKAIGGIIGYSYNNSIIVNCYSHLNINNYGVKSYSGGLVGVMQNDCKTLNSYTRSSITGDGSNQNYLGGIVGFLMGGCEVENCYTDTNIVSHNNPYSDIGAIAGCNNGGKVSQSSYNKSSIQQIGTTIRTEDQTLGMGYCYNNGTGSTNKYSLSYMTTNMFTDILNDNVTKLVAKQDGVSYKLWRIIDGTNNNLPMINGVNNNKITIKTNPYVGNLYIDGYLEKGETLLAHYTYGDLDNDLPGKAEIKWYRSDSANDINPVEIANANSMAYQLSDKDVGKYIYFSVIPKSANGDTGKLFITKTTDSIIEPKTYTQLKNKSAGDIIRFGGKEWILLDPIESMLMLKDKLYSMKFQSNVDQDSNKYELSTIRNYLNTTFLNSIDEKSRSYIRDINWNCTRIKWQDIDPKETPPSYVKDKVGLLSVDNCKTYKQYIAHPNPTEEDWKYYSWLLNSPYDKDYYGYVFDKNGDAIATWDAYIHEALSANPVIYLKRSVAVDSNNNVDLRHFYSPHGFNQSPTNIKTPTWSWKSRSKFGSGIYRYKLNNGAYIVSYNITVDLLDPLNYQVIKYSPSYTPAALPDGEHTLYIQELEGNYYYDVFNKKLDGFWSDEAQLKIVIDTIAPTINTNLVDNTVFEDPLIFTAEAVDSSENVTLEIKLNNTVVTNESQNQYSLTLNMGVNTITLIATDAAGNTASKSITVYRYPLHTGFAGGKGVQGDPYQIATAEQLRYFSDLVNGSDDINATLSYELIANIDLSGTEWVPIGHTKPFKGKFCGNGYVIKNLEIGNQTAPAVGKYFGLFGKTEGADISNVGIENIYINAGIESDTTYLGGLVAFSISSEIKNCFVTGELNVTTIGLNTNSVVGGLIGEAEFTNNIYNSFTNIKIKTTGEGSKSGGLIGSTAIENRIYNCYAVSDIECNCVNGGLLGGFIGADSQINIFISNGYWNCIGINEGIGTGYDTTVNKSLSEMKYPQFASLLTSNAHYLNANLPNLDASHWGITPNVNQGLPFLIDVGNKASSKKEILTFSFIEQTGYAAIDNTNNTIDIEVAYGTDITDLLPTITVSQLASISPASGDSQDYSNPVTYTVTAEDGSTQDYVVTVVVASAPSSTKEITMFSLNEQTGSAVISNTNQTVNIEVAYGTALTSLLPTITVSPQANINPNSGVAQNFNNPVIYTVTAEDGSTQDYIITVTVATAPSSEKEITSFTLNEQTGNAVISNTNYTVAIEVAYGTNISSLSPSIAISSLATINPNSGATQNFTNPVTYTVTAEDGSMQDYIVTVTVAPPPSSEKDITAFTLTQQMGSTVINNSNHTVNLEVVNTSNVTSLAPIVAVSPKASISPSSGAAQDFTNPVTYTVTAEDGSTQSYVVTVSVSSTIDNTSPTISTSLVNNTTSADKQVFAVVASDDYDLNPLVSVNCGGKLVTQNGSGNYTVYLREGKNIILISATDNSGNTVTISREVTREVFVESDNIVERKEQNHKRTTTIENGKPVIKTDITFSTMDVLMAAAKAKKQNKPVIIDISSVKKRIKESEKDYKQKVNLTFTNKQVSKISRADLVILGHLNTQIELPKELLQQISNSEEGLNIEVSNVELNEVIDYVQENEKVYLANEINTSHTGKTIVRFVAPKNIDISKLKIKILHSEGDIEVITPKLVKIGKTTYLEFIVNRFSTFMVYEEIIKNTEQADPNKEQNETEKPNNEEPKKEQHNEQKTIIKLTVNQNIALVNDKEHLLKAAPFINETTERTLVPVRFVSEIIGATVKWTPEKQQVEVIDENKKIILTINSTKVKIGEKIITVDSPAQIVNSKAFIPLRFISEALGADVKYIAKTQTIIITNK